MSPTRPRISRISFHQADRVAAAYLDAPRAPRSSLVEQAYASLAMQVDRWFRWLTDDHNPWAVRVVHTRNVAPYPTARDLARQVRRERILELSPASHDRDRRHPLLDGSIGGTYDRFRAVHDVVSHAWCGFGFDRNGEFSAWILEDRMYRGLARHVVATELHAQHSVLWTTGCLADHKAVMLDSRLIDRSRRIATAFVSPHEGDVDRL